VTFSLAVLAAGSSEWLRWFGRFRARHSWRTANWPEALPAGCTGRTRGALTQVDLRQRKKELDALRGRLASKEDLVAFNEKNLVYKRLQGALPRA
jgi:hypothetical protein